MVGNQGCIEGKVKLAEEHEPALFMTIRCDPPIATEAQWVPGSRVAIDPLHQEEQWVPGVSPREEGAYRGPVALPLQRVNSTVTD